MNPSSVFFDARNPRDSCPGSPDVDVRHASDLLRRFSMAASDTSSARLTPSPHCSPGSSPKRRHLALDLSGDEAPASQSRAATNDPLDQFRYDPAREPTFPSAWGVGMGIDMPGSGGLGPWTVNVRATSGSSQSRWPFAQRSPAPSPTISDLAHRPQEIRGDAANDGLDVSPRGASPWDQRSQARADRLSDSGLEWRTTARPLRNGFEPRQTLRARTARPLSMAMAENTQQSQPTGFQPMMAVAEPERRRNSLAVMQLRSQDTNKFSTRYHGMHTENNASADYLPPSQNCALWLTNLPADVEYSELLHAMGRIGRIWCTFINLPDNIKHHTAAAKVVFFTPEAAQRLLTKTCVRPIIIRGLRVKAAHNRIKYSANITSGNMSRVLIITGKKGFVNPENLHNWFEERFVFQKDKAFLLLCAGERAVCEFRFGSYRCQAQMGKMALKKPQPVGFEKVDFGPDPCEVGEDLSSFGIAAARIQGK
ncbi:hypothetical protein OCS_04131 [Ophiocordyceps sinensis CO18]|uniref:RRM domain-containing protein n=1 Tax=Ophiocordyceps sinensis (strain Co18 / CGMCC 3.14243) TaxID=911162 RepID=T5AC69_OPHSC|nr:hypothetical protein OCS_04131 [Ophiocordyceps sinensis CO18]